METDIPKEVIYVMQILEDLQHPNLLKDAEKRIESAPLEDIIPPLIKIITADVDNPEVMNSENARFLRQSAAINLKNLLIHRYKTKVNNFFNKEDVVKELLVTMVEILISGNDPLICPHLAITISRILRGINAEGGLIVDTINRIYKKVENNPDSIASQQMGIKGIYEIIKEFSKSTEVLEDLKCLDYLWKDNFSICADRLGEYMQSAQKSKEGFEFKDIFRHLVKILIKMMKVLGKETGIELIKYTKDLKLKFFKLAIENAKHCDDESKTQDLKVILSLQKLEIYGVDYLALDKNDLELYIEISEYYYNIAFDNKFIDDLKSSYLPKSFGEVSLEHDTYELSGILAQGIKFHKNIFDNPVLWVDDMLYSEEEPDSVQKVEERLKNYYDEERLRSMCECIISCFLPYDMKELSMWSDDPVEFYIQTKETNTVSLLREATIGFIKSLKMRFPKFLIEYSKNIKELIFTKYKNLSNSYIQSFVEKEALYHFLQESIDIEDDLGEDGLLPLIEQELMQKYQNDGLLKKRIIEILASISYELSNLEDKKYIFMVVESVTKLFVELQDPCLKLTCIYFFHQFYDNYYLERDRYASYVPDIFSISCEFILVLRKDKNQEAIYEILDMFKILTQKYPDVSQKFIEKSFIYGDNTLFAEKYKLVPVISQLVAVIEDENITQDLVDYTCSLLIEVYNPPVENDVFMIEEAMKLLLIYLRRLQNFSSELQNPFYVNLPLFQIVEKLMEQLELDDDEKLNAFLVLEEMHFSLHHATADVTEQAVLDTYIKIFNYGYEVATDHEDANMITLTGYFASTLMISNNFSKEICDLACKLRDKVKEDIIRQLIKEKENPSPQHKTYLDAYLLLFCCIGLNDINLGIIDNITQKPEELEFFNLLNEIGPEYTAKFQELFCKKTEDEEECYSDDEQGSSKHLPICYAIVYLCYGNMIKAQNQDLLEYTNQEIRKQCEWVIEKATEAKDNMLVINDGLYICNCFKDTTKDIDMGLLLDIPSKKKLISKHKTHLVLNTFLSEHNLLKMLME